MKRLILVFLIFTFTNICYAEPNLVGWWKLDSDADDYSGQDNNGTIYGDPCFVTGQVDGALDLDGLDDCVLVPDANSLDVVTGDMTLSVWINPADLGDGGIVGKYGNWSYYNFALWYESGNIYYEVGHSGTSSDDPAHFEIKVNSSIIDTPNQWYHVVGTYDHSVVRLYVDANEVDSANETRDLGQSSRPLCIGNVRYDGLSYHSWNETNAYSNGKIDDVRIYDRALDANEISELYEYKGEGKAFGPNPYNGQTMVDPNTVLSWYPGFWAADVNGHDVYFGTDFNDLNDANTTVTLGVYTGRRDANSWDPCGLEWGKWYYWRIDEVNEPNIVKGDVWDFKTALPFIELSDTLFLFHGDWDTPANPDDQRLTITNGGPGTTLNWTITCDCNWLTVEPNSGSCFGGESNDVVLSVDITGLAEGDYDCNLTVSDPCAENSPQIVSVILTNECFPSNHPDYDTWVSVGRPECWCYPRQCYGDTDNYATGDPKQGYTYVNAIDLTLFMTAWDVREPPMGPGLTGDQICADIDHKLTGDPKGGFVRVSAPDLTIFMNWWDVKEPPVGPGVPTDCLDCP